MTAGAQPFQIKLSFLLIWGVGIVLDAGDAFRRLPGSNFFQSALSFGRTSQLAQSSWGATGREHDRNLRSCGSDDSMAIRENHHPSFWIRCTMAADLSCPDSADNIHDALRFIRFFFRLMVWIRNVALKARIPGRNFFEMAGNSLGNFGWTSIFRSSLHL